jgi:hypothetical protein
VGSDLEMTKIALLIALGLQLQMGQLTCLTRLHCGRSIGAIPISPLRTAPKDTRSNDRWFQLIAIITSDMEKAYAWLRQNRIEHASTGPQPLPDWNKNAGGIKAFYFRDPDRHYLEILQFSEGKGDPKWHRHSDKLFLGIDHTAIVVSKHR